MSTGGFAGQILHVDLTSREIRIVPLDLPLARDYIGGLGLSIKLAYDHGVPGSDALSPENPVVIGAGPLVGTDLPAASRVFAVTRLPASGTIGWCGAGGVTLGCGLKNAGFDHIVITGRSERPVQLRITDDKAELCDAAGLWGMSADETCDAIWETEPWPTGVLAIGQAGENLCRFSMASVNRIATLGRGGFGAVMGSKRLKAITACGSKGIGIADRKQYRRLTTDFLEQIRSYPHLEEWQRLGMIKSFPVVEPALYEKIKKRRVSCVSCPLGCKDIIEIPDGEFKGMVVYTSSVVNLFTGIMYGMKDYRESIRLIAILDGYGLDMFEFFAVTGFAAALARAGIIPPDLAKPGVDIRSLGSMQVWAEKIAFREGLGDAMADGCQGLINRFGPECEPYAPALIKGMHPYAGPGAALPWNLFGTMELGQILDPRGPHVGSGGSPTYFAKRPLQSFPKHLDRMGVPQQAFERILQEQGGKSAEPELRVGRLLKYSHNWFSILGSMGICARAQVNRFYSAGLCAEMYESVTGIPAGPDVLRQRADRIWTLLRLANLREGFDRQAMETPPGKWFQKDGFKDYVTEKPLTADDVRQMTRDYYQEWGWDPETGIPLPETLEKLGIDG